MGSLSVGKGWNTLDKGGVPNYDHPERAVKALEAMYRYGAWTGARPEALPAFRFDNAAIGSALEAATAAGMATLGERHARRILEACGVAMPLSVLASTAERAAQAGVEIGFPVVLKVSSDDILHKSDAGGVRVNLNGKAEVRRAYREIMAAAKAYKADARTDGVLVQQMVAGGTEAIVGMKRDPQFGPVIMFGLGGVYVEVLKDVAFRVAPLSASDAREMVGEIRSAAILEGARGQEPADVDALVDCILRLSQLSVEHPRLTECDINPLKVFDAGKGVCALDVRFALQKPLAAFTSDANARPSLPRPEGS
jgi:acyl-CoA synthetase (NDP forming)